MTPILGLGGGGGGGGVCATSPVHTRLNISKTVQIPTLNMIVPYEKMHSMTPTAVDPLEYAPTPKINITLIISDTFKYPSLNHIHVYHCSLL